MQSDSFASDGFALVSEVLQAGECDEITRQLTPTESVSGGTRSLLSQQWCARLADKLRSHAVISRLLPAKPVAVQCTYFEKSPAKNWLVALHRDLSIPVAERVADPELRGWSEKEGILFVQPPSSILEQLVAVRVHLDACSAADGPLRVVPGSHLWGRLDTTASQSIGSVPCTAARGSALAMRPLLLHASSKSDGISLRRVLHFVFGPTSLSHGLRWHHSV
jgi:hypothetical protein